ncbi:MULTISPECIES: substrate-binding domain-containing protein [unclassified Mesorhizobium]|uniref:substrate-binding domain-containing protein n=1 Tax=unclassified Mesorhizobium TaxID=325217 RepID=UPI000FD5D022|nr:MULTISPECIES: substrate-binding domain-containing protein [unclassified Mesorhizobium]RUV81464.1 ABC transporter substrate-binding protein [Mesorhizobium sp. M5C.F.Ca.IN.020.14.1.1]RUV28757.1 ABC transporter substrate-binding protein [Mesorhizobium sp. M5C.F.Ca.IN.020.32.2.1]RWG50749.1 MAG: ABC transporter substrate-binding protein [Mesorhizobium sp.]RWH55721.1 MAG: ABC transporter substrate-binding protein [Mesorhizobium sp.]RWI67758.1 MAG: ABC transporter substrate-binding protein [Mesorh
MTPKVSTSQGKTITLASTLALQTVMESIGSTLDGRNLRLTFAPTKILLDRLRNGEQADVVVLTREGILRLVEEGILNPNYQDIAISSIGIAQAIGASAIDISTPEKLRDVLVGTGSIAYSASGASGIFFAELIRRLDIEELVRRKAIISPAGFTGEFVAKGQAEIAIQQLSELHAVGGLGPITPLPDEAQCLTVFSAASATRSASPDALDAITAALTSEDGRSQLRAAGLQPV